MNFQWMAQSGPYPIVEFHDVRTEPGGADRYLARVEIPVSGHLAAHGHGGSLGQFAVARHPDRMLLMRGFQNLAVRRRALGAVCAEPGWARRRAESADLVRSGDIMLMRAITPESGVRPLRPGEGLVAMISEVRFAEQIGSYHLWLRLLLRKAGMDPLAAFATLEAINDVPAVPVVRNKSQHIALMRIARGSGVPELPRELRDMLRFPPEVLTLEPALSPVW
jgi:hypothetical protein